MRHKSPKILLVMHEIPVNSGFLAAKFIKLSEQAETHLLVWGSDTEVQKFISKYHLPDEHKKRIHNVSFNIAGIIKAAYLLVVALFKKSTLRVFFLTSNDKFIEKLKFAIAYSPAIGYNWDIIHFEFGTIARQAVRLKEIVSAKLIVSFRGYDLNYAGIDDEKYYEQVWNKCDGFHFLGNDLKQRAIKRGYNTNEYEVLIPPAIDTSFFSPQPNEKIDTTLVITSVGRLVWKKGYEYAIHAMYILKQAGVAFEYNIIGAGEAKQELEYIINEAGLSKEVKLLGLLSAENVKEQLIKADVFLHPAISEGFSNAVLEAQSMGLPVICTDADGLPENIVDGITGFVIPKWDPVAIADKIIWCNNNRDILKEMGKAGMNRVRTLFRIEDQVQAFLNYYKRVVSDNG